MTTNQKKKESFLFHPILFGLYPVLALYIINRNETVFSAISRAAATSVIVTVLIIGVYLLIFRSWRKAAAPASLTLLLFYSYGHVYDLLQNTRLFGVLMGRDRVLVPVWIVLFILGIILLLRSKTDLLNQILNTVSLVLMIFVFVQLGIHFVQYGGSQTDQPEKSVSAQGSSTTANPEARDVYYILVDAHSRQDLLQEKLDLDNSEFISELTRLGFYIPECAQSNYDNTLPSMTTVLNMNYLDAMGLPYFVDDKSEYKTQIKNNLVMKQFKEQGYDIATFKSLYRLLDFPDQTYYYDYFKNVSDLNSQASLNFQYLFLKTTLVRPLMEFIERNPEIKLPSAIATWIPVGNILDSHEYRQYQQNMFALDSLEKIPDLPGKKFVYAHLYTTHQPFVFYPDGEFHPHLQQDDLAYRDQVVFTDARLLEIVKTILAKSQPAPIIVIQGDHSYFQGADRVKIINAYYLPDGGDKALYPTITPVNTFRVIFNTYFGGDYELLPDVSRYSQNKVLYEAPSTCVGKAGTN
jgi:hypothetical protein